MPDELDHAIGPRRQLGRQLQELVAMPAAVAAVSDTYVGVFIDLTGRRWAVAIQRLDHFATLWGDAPSVGWDEGIAIEADRFDDDSRGLARDVRTWLAGCWLAAIGSEFDGKGV